MQSIAALVVLHLTGLYGQWLGYHRGLVFLVAFWGLAILVVWLSDHARWLKITQTGVQSAGLVILLLFRLNILSWG